MTGATGAGDVPVAHPPCGPVTGWADGPVTRFTGIPYAQARRFAAPEPFLDWTAARPATTWAPACPQQRSPHAVRMFGSGLERLAQDEHCQQVSVTVPAGTAPGDRLPVMVWIHGGSNVFGAGDAASTDPVLLVAEQRVVVVTVTYRLGLLGYLAGPGRPGNLGLLDQREAFRWVRRNIGAFGGDPGNVTAFGQSAGGDAIAHLLVLNEERLFDRAIIQSAPFGLIRGQAPMRQAMGRLARGVTAQTPLPALLRTQARAVAVAVRFGTRAGMAFGPEPGHPPLPEEDGYDAAWDAVAPHTPVLVGWAAQENSYFSAAVPAIAAMHRRAGLRRRLDGAVAATTRAVYVRDAERFVDRYRQAGGAAHSYEVEWQASTSWLGSPHNIDLPLLFGVREAWTGGRMLEGIPWEAVEADGRRVRRVWADVARGEAPVSIPGVLTVH